MKLALKVIPNAKKSEAVGWEEDPRAGRALKLRIAAPPVEGKANKVVVLFLSAWLDIPRSSISLLARGILPAESGGTAGRMRGKTCPAAFCGGYFRSLGKPGGRQAFSLCVEGLHQARSITRQTSSMS